MSSKLLLMGPPGMEEEKEEKDEEGSEEKSSEEHMLENACDDLAKALRGEDKCKMVEAFKLMMDLCKEDSEEEEY